MAQYISKSALVAEIKERIETYNKGYANGDDRRADALEVLLYDIDTLEVKEINSIVSPYDAYIQYTDRESAIKAHAEDYSWNIESELFQQLTPEQQKLWRKEIEQACISGGYCGLNLQKDRRYDDTLEVKEVNLDYIRKELDELIRFNKPAGDFGWGTLYNVATHFFKLGVNASNPLTWEDVKLIWTIGDEIPYMPEEDFFKELLKRFKAQKGE